MNSNHPGISVRPGRLPRFTLLFAALAASFALAQAETRFCPIDLQSHFTRFEGDAYSSWSALPWGSQKLGGVPFEIQGAVEVTGLGPAANKQFFPPQVTGIQIGRKAVALHVLHANSYNAPEGTPIARLVLHYENGESRAFHFRYGEHVRNWWKERAERAGNVTDPNTAEVWAGTSPYVSQPGVTLRLFKTRLANPLPDQTIVKADLYSLFARASEVMVALTIEEADPAQTTPRPIPDSATELAKEQFKVRREILVRTLDAASAQPVARVPVKLQIAMQAQPMPFGEQKTDELGRAVLAFPAAATTLIFDASAVAGTARAQLTGPDFPAEVTLKLGSAQQIGGVVKAESGQAIKGAKVLVNSIEKDAAGQFLAVKLDEVTTDAAGQWTSSSVSSATGALNFIVSHPEFMPAEYDEDDTAGPATVTRQQLLASQSTMILPPAIRVEGVVKDASGQPVAGAQISLAPVVGRNERAPQPRRTATDLSGRFQLHTTATGAERLTVLADGFGLLEQSLEIKRDLQPLELKLTPTHGIRGVVQDSSGQPVAGATVEMAPAEGHAISPWQMLTDEQGEFAWTSAPNIPTAYRVTKSGFQTQDLKLAAGQSEIVVLRKQFRVSGRVLDAETGEPIREFTMMIGFVRSYRMSDRPDDDVNWDRYSQKAGKDGAYLFELTRSAPSQLFRERAEDVRLLIEADGYLPASSPDFFPAEWHTHDFALKRGEGLSGTVLTPAGDAAEGAEIAALGVDYWMLSQSGLKGSNPRSALVRTDANGKFKLKAALKPPPLVIAHPSGFAELRADALEQNPTVKLQAWGRIEGVLKNGTQPAANEKVSLSHGILDFNYDSRHFRAVTDEQGRFAFTHVPPGDRQLARLVPLGPRSMLFSHSELVEVKPGEVSHVLYGGKGRPITGRLKLSDPAVSPDWSNGHFSIRSKTPVFRQLPNGGTFASASYGFTVNEDGSFKAHNVPAGRYTLSLDLRDPGSAGSVPSVMLSRPVATLRQDFEVPEIPGGVSDEPFDLGTLILSVVKSR